MTEMREVRVGDLFTPTPGRFDLVRSYLEAYPGKYPVFSASLTRTFGSIDSFDYDGKYLTWVRSGYAGRMRIIEGRFSTNHDRCVLVPRDGVRTPSLTYLRFALEPLLTAQAVGRRVDGRRNEYTKLYPSTVADIVVTLPVEPLTGELDYDAMEELGRRLERVNAIRSQLSAIATDISEAELTFAEPAESSLLSMGDRSVFRLSIGQRLVLKDIRSPHSHGVPVYSANVRRVFGRVESAGELTFEHPSLLWGIDGVFDWSLLPAGEEFVPTDHCGRAEILDKRIDPEYLCFALRATRSEYGFDRVFRANLTNVAQLVHATIPLDPAGQPCLASQQRMADEHRRLLRFKQSALQAIDEVLDARLAPQLAG
ncbi:MAG: restriction endonuclease subunit S [Propionicimonas sp.]|uniref:restriction endonuclease subunit S n=1 Tax=Propionicimonas sp. TaxID=1955623 RepID=UPI003D0CC0AB